MQQLRPVDTANGADAIRSPVTRPWLHTSEPSPAPSVGLARFWRPVARKGADVICGEAAASAVAFHAHEAVQVLLPLSRFHVIRGGGRTTLVRPGVVHLTGPLELHALRGINDDPFSTRILLVSPASLTRRLGTQVTDPAGGLAELLVEDAALYGELMGLFDALRRPLVAIGCESRLLDCVARVATDRAVATSRDSSAIPPRGVTRAREYLRAHVVDSVTLDELAGVARLSKFYLLRAFHRAYGMTPHSYQMQLRLARARRLLADGRPLSHVTYDAAFADQSHLTRRFAAFYGLTPARFARQLAIPPGAAPDPNGSPARAAMPPAA